MNGTCLYMDIEVGNTELTYSSSSSAGRFASQQAFALLTSKKISNITMNNRLSIQTRYSEFHVDTLIYLVWIYPSDVRLDESRVYYQLLDEFKSWTTFWIKW
jgi:hypothetical protein